jgi:hypothetical protein
VFQVKSVSAIYGALICGFFSSCKPAVKTSPESEVSSLRQAYQFVLTQAVSNRCKYYLSEWYGQQCSKGLNSSFDKLDYLDPDGKFDVAFFQTLEKLSSQNDFRIRLQTLSAIFDKKIRNREPLDLFQETLSLCHANTDCALEILGVAMQDICGREVIELAEKGKLQHSSVWTQFNNSVQIPLCRGLMPAGSKLLPQLKYDTGDRQGSIYHFYSNAYIARKVVGNWIFPAIFNMTYEQLFSRPGSKKFRSWSGKIYQLSRLNEILSPEVFLRLPKNTQQFALQDTYLGFAGASWGASPSSASRVLSYTEFKGLFETKGYETAVSQMIQSIDRTVAKKGAF